MQETLKSKIHKTVVTQSNPDYEDRIGIKKGVSIKSEHSS